MKKSKKTQNEKKTKPMPIPPWPGGGPRPSLTPGTKLGGELILTPETWKRINEIAANPEKYMYDPDEYSGEAGELKIRPDK